MIAGMCYPHMPEATGVLRAIDLPTHNDLMPDENPDATSQENALINLLHSGETWTVD
jgi:hypothetical protein